MENTRKRLHQHRSHVEDHSCKQRDSQLNVSNHFIRCTKNDETDVDFALNSSDKTDFTESSMQQNVSHVTIQNAPSQKDYLCSGGHARGYRDQSEELRIKVDRFVNTLNCLDITLKTAQLVKHNTDLQRGLDVLENVVAVTRNFTMELKLQAEHNGNQRPEYPIRFK